MNKVMMIFTAFRVYRQARARESSTLRGAITGFLAAGVVVALWSMGVELTAGQIGVVLASITGLDAVLKIALPDQLGGRNKDDQKGVAGADSVGTDPDHSRGADGLRVMPTHDDAREDTASPLDPFGIRNQS